MAFIANSVALSTIIIILSIAVLIYVSLKGYHLFIAALAGAFILSFADVNGFVTAWSVDFVDAGATMVGKMFLFFLSGALLGGVADASGCGQRLGSSLTKWFGAKNVIWIIIIFQTLCLLAGIGLTTFIIWAFAIPLLRATDYPKAVGMMVQVGMNAVVGCNLFLTPNSCNIINAASFGISYINEFWWASLIMTVVGVVLIYLFAMRCVKENAKKGWGFNRPGELDTNTSYELRPEEDLPPFLLAVSPFLLSVIVAIVCNRGFGWNISVAVSFAQFFAAFFCLVTNYKRIKVGHVELFYGSMMKPIPAFIASIVITGFGGMISNTSAYTALINTVSASNMNPYILTFVMMALLAFSVADSVGSSAMFGSTMVPYLMSTGANAAAMQRIASATATTFDSMPWSYMAGLNLSVWGYDIKTGYKYLGETTVVVTTITALLGVVLAIIFFPIG